MFTLRNYQQDAIDAAYQHLRERKDNPCIVMPTGSGKTPVVATICHDVVNRWDGRVLILAHVKELIEQTAEKLKFVSPELKFGIYSAGLKSRNTDDQVIVAGIQSVSKRACELGSFNLILVDEAHTIPPEGEGMYQTFLSEAKVVNPDVRVIGLTATPFRLRSGLICRPEYILNHVCFEIGVKELIDQGFLSQLRTESGAIHADTSRVHVRGGEFVAAEVEDLMDQDELVKAACSEIVTSIGQRRTVLIFTAGIQHGRHVQDVLRQDHQIDCGFVCGTTPAKERDATLNAFREGKLRVLCNVNVLTTGFDAPNIDCIVILRPTMSPGLYYQMVGRGFRLHPDKPDCLVLDFGGNVERHGPVDAIRIATRKRKGTDDGPKKRCPECQATIAAGFATCPHCGYVFPPPERQLHETQASQAEILSGPNGETRYEVLDIGYSVHTKRGAEPDAPKTMRVDYQVGPRRWVSEYIALEHVGYARERAVAWWRQRSREPVPPKAQEVVKLAENGALRVTRGIVVRPDLNNGFDRIIRYELGELPTMTLADGSSDDKELFF